MNIIDTLSQSGLQKKQVEVVMKPRNYDELSAKNQDELEEKEEMPEWVCKALIETGKFEEV